MKILAVETSSVRGSVALLDGDRVLGEKGLGEGSQHARALVASADALLGGHPEAVDLLAVSAGPGSYTGLRVGITFAKTFAVQRGTPLVTVSSLDVIAANISDPVRLCVVVDARLGQVYAARYDADRNKVAGDIAARPLDVAAGLEPGTVVIGDGLRRYRETFAEMAKVVDDESAWWPRAANAGKLGRIKFLEKGGEDPHALVPRYLRRPQAEVIWEKPPGASGPR